MAVVTSASAIPPATAPRPVAFCSEMPLNAFRIPSTVPNSPTNGAVEPMVAGTPVGGHSEIGARPVRGSWRSQAAKTDTWLRVSLANVASMGCFFLRGTRLVIAILYHFELWPGTLVNQA